MLATGRPVLLVLYETDQEDMNVSNNSYGIEINLLKGPNN